MGCKITHIFHSYLIEHSVVALHFLGLINQEENAARLLSYLSVWQEISAASVVLLTEDQIESLGWLGDWKTGSVC